MADTPLDIVRFHQKTKDWILKKTENRPPALRRLMIRTLGTATRVVAEVADMPFEKLSMRLYVCGQEASGYREFARACESQIELANIDPERFARQLHKYFCEQERKIRKDNLFAMFFDFVQIFVRLHFGKEIQTEPEMDRVVNAYLDLLGQQMVYLLPDKYNFESLVAGLDSHGQFILVPDVYPDMDAGPNLEVRGPIDPVKMERDTLEFFRSRGYPANNAEDVQLMRMRSDCYSSQIMVLLPYISEQTMGILPQHPFSCDCTDLMRYRAFFSLEDLTRKLHRRRRLLPVRGYQVRFSSGFIQAVLYQETQLDDRIVVLYRASTIEGDLCGFYDHRDDWFFSMVTKTLGPENARDSLALAFQKLILAGYASWVLDDPDYHTNSFAGKVRYGNLPVSATGVSLGGGGTSTGTGRPGGSRLQDDRYELAEREVIGHIRKLPEGQRPSEGARRYAEGLGLELDDNETYVRPHMTRVVRLRPVGGM